VSFARHLSQFARGVVRGAAAASQQRQRTALNHVTALDAKSEKLDAEWEKMRARFDNYFAAVDLADPVALQGAFDYINERIEGLVHRTETHAHELAVYDVDAAQNGLDIAEVHLDAWAEIKPNHVELMKEIRDA